MWKCGQEHALMSEIGKVKDEHTQAMTRIFDMCEKLHENQKSQERQLTGLRTKLRSTCGTIS